MMNIREESLQKHYEWQGKIEVVSRVAVNDTKDLSLAYTPGVAEPCLEIQKDYEKSFQLTRRSNLVAVITDGTAVLGLGDIGPEAGMPVMEGKCALFKEFAGVDAFPICVRSKDVDEIVRTVYLISGSFGGINLEDIAAPRCFEIERKLKEICDIPVFHDDQHGTAIIVAAAVLNALKVVKKDLGEINAVINGSGSAGIAIAKHLLNLGLKNLTMVDRAGIIYEGMDGLNPEQQYMSTITNRSKKTGTLADAMKNADLFIGVSAPNIVNEEMVKSMADEPIIFAMANPTPEIMPDIAKKAGARIVGTGRSDFPNQINNVLAFPGIFRGALDCRASEINEEMKAAASYAIASLVSDDELNDEYILPKAFDRRVGKAVAEAGIVRTKDLKTWERLDNLKTLCSPQQRNVVLHPEFVDGKYAFYTRPMDGFIETGSGGGIGFGLCDDITHAVIDEEKIISKRIYHTLTESKNGAGAVPIRGKKCWINIAHGVRNTAAGLRYVIYAFATDLNDPSKVIAEPSGLLIGPRGEERVGDVSNVVFTNGAIVNDKNEVFIYYASSDTRMHVATTTIDRLIDYVFNTPQDPGRSVLCVQQRCDLIKKNLEYLKNHK